MKKTLLLIASLAVAFPAAAVVTDCVQRIDNNLDKSTKEKVAYCLAPANEPLPDMGTTTQIVTLGSEGVKKPATKKRIPPAQPKKKRIKKYNKAKEVRSVDYLEYNRYPEFRNDIISSYDEKLALEAAGEAVGIMACDENGSCAYKMMRREAMSDTLSVGTPEEIRKQQEEKRKELEAYYAKHNPEIEKQVQGEPVSSHFLSDELLILEGYEAAPPPSEEEEQAAQQQRVEELPPTFQK